MPRKGEPLHYRPRSDLSVPRDISAIRKLVHFPTQAEADLRRANRRRTIAARGSLSLMALSPLATIYLNVPGYWTAGVAAAALVIFAMCCLSGAHDNERKS